MKKKLIALLTAAIMFGSCGALIACDEEVPDNGGNGDNSNIEVPDDFYVPSYDNIVGDKVTAEEWRKCNDFMGNWIGDDYIANYSYYQYLEIKDTYAISNYSSDMKANKSGQSNACGYYKCNSNVNVLNQDTYANIDSGTYEIYDKVQHFELYIQTDYIEGRTAYQYSSLTDKWTAFTGSSESYTVLIMEMAFNAVESKYGIFEYDEQLGGYVSTSAYNIFGFGGTGKMVVKVKDGQLAAFQILSDDGIGMKLTIVFYDIGTTVITPPDIGDLAE